MPHKIAQTCILLNNEILCAMPHGDLVSLSEQIHSIAHLAASNVSRPTDTTLTACY
eukprot:m.1291526 g.1291526  ORF g.1291526 m.1291526 type:complete len:56 (+) comp24786_c0_seq11:4048-4215(+)